MKKMLLVIDLQKSFVNKQTKKLPSKIDKLIDSNKYDYVVFTRFINDQKSLWVKKLNFKGCITEKDKQIVIDTKDYKVLDKNVYTAFNSELQTYIKNKKINQIYLCGLDTDACVYKTAVDLFENNYDVYILKNYCMSNAGRKTHRYAIKNLKRLIGDNSII